MSAGTAGSVDVAQRASLLNNFDRLTAKQHEVFALVAEGRTTKEIAWRLNVTDSAVNQRIEAVRNRAGSPPRAELARAYRRYMALRAVGRLEDDPQSGDTNAKVGEDSDVSCDPKEEHDSGDNAGSSQWIVPKAFVGPGASLNRTAAMMTIAVGLLGAALLGLGVVHALNALF